MYGYYSPGADNHTLLHFSVYANNIELMNYLLKQGVNLNIKTTDGETALDIAIRRNNLNAVKLLKSYINK